MVMIATVKNLARLSSSTITGRLLSYAKVSTRASEKEFEGKWIKRKKMILPSLIDFPSPTVEEAVDNILYNNPTAPPTKIKKHTVGILLN